MNMAALWKLPIIYACENNLYGEYTKVEEMAAGHLTARAAAFGIETFEVDGQDVLAVFRLAQELVDRARKGEGPFFLLLNTYRYMATTSATSIANIIGRKKKRRYWKIQARSDRDFRQVAARREARFREELARNRRGSARRGREAVAYALAAPYPALEEVGMHVFLEK